MSMSKKDYEFIAGTIRLYAEAPARTAQEKSWFKSLAVDIAVYCANNNKCFDVQRFMKACGF